MLGEVGDTFSGTSYSGGDKECRGLLDADGGGTMGAVRYPRLHISLPVRHGTDAATLEKSAGHLYGTSLPVGGESTHAVVAAHRGLADKLMFTNLGLAKKGDLFEIDVQGERLRYEVANIRVTGPDDVRPLAIEKGRDLVTLYTCTPYGVNTQRLLVTGERTDAPSDGNPQSGGAAARLAGATGAAGAAVGFAGNVGRAHTGPFQEKAEARGVMARKGRQRRSSMVCSVMFFEWRRTYYSALKGFTHDIYVLHGL